MFKKGCGAIDWGIKKKYVDQIYKKEKRNMSIELTEQEVTRINAESTDKHEAIKKAFELGKDKALKETYDHIECSNPVFYNCSFEDLKKLEGYTIDKVLSVLDESGEGFIIRGCRMIGNVEVRREFSYENGKSYISGEYIGGIR